MNGEKFRGPFSKLQPDWTPFLVTSAPAKTRSLKSPDGLGDRLRFVAFAEKQAQQAFYWAAEILPDAAPEVREIWRTLAREEEKHMNWLLTRMKELKVDVAARSVNLILWESFFTVFTARDFAEFMANAEERGRIAGEKFQETLRDLDPVSADLFGRIAEEETQHIELAKRAFDLIVDARG